MVMPRRIESKVQLLVEGKDQKNFFEHYCHHLSLHNIDIQNFGGIHELSSFLEILVKAPDFNKVIRLGIVRDAEEDAKSAFQSVQSALNKEGLISPDSPLEFIDGIPSVAVLILPGDHQTGMLETLLCQTITDEPENACIEEFFECLKNRKTTSLAKPDKSRAHCFLSTKKYPESSVGVAAKKGYWNLNHDALNHVRDFLRELAS